MDSQAVAMETQAATNQISISNTMTLDASQIDGNSIIAIDNDGNRIPIIIAPSDSKENGEIKMNDGESVPVVYVENSEEKQGDEEMTENEFEAIVVEQSGDQDLANIQFNVYKTDNNSLVIQIPNDSIAETQIEEQVIEESVQTTIDDIKVAAMSTTCECDICGEYFTNLKDHLTRHPDIETLYSCDTCGKLFSSSDRLTIHLNIHAGNIEDEVITVEKEVESASSNKVGDFVCDVCHKTFTLSKYLQAHKLVHSENKPFQCSMCDKRFSQKRYLKAHELLHKGIKPFNCSKCPKTFTNVTALKAHLNSHIGLKPYKCTMCPKAFYRQSNLSAHVKRHSDPPIKVDYDNKIRCECNLSFINEEELQAHVGMHTGPELFKCTYCTAEFRLLCKLQDHAKMHMGSEKAYECQICGRAYRHKNSLRSHLASHAQEKLWKCNICDKRFSLQGNLRTHEKLHTGLKPFKCELCNKSFARIDHMRQHRKVHDGIRPYKCDICNKAFSRSHHYQAHINNIHNETKPHECNICHKRFGYASNLRTHEKIHYLNKDHQKVFNKCRACGQMITFIQTETTVLQKKEFKCEDCGELFHCAQSLTIHQNSHRGDIPFRCNYCEKQFTNNKNLNKHLKIHSGARAYVCHVCDKTFIFGHHLKRHLMTHTGNHVVKKEEVTIEEDEEDMENGLNDDNNMMKDDGEVTDLQTEEELNKSEVIEDESVRTDDDTSTEKSNKTANNEGSLETTGKSDKISKTKFTDVICLKRKTDTPDDNGDASAQDKNDSDLKAKDSKGQGQNDSKSSKKGRKVQNEDSDVNAEKSSKLDQEGDKTTRNRKSMKKNESGKKVKDTHKPGVRVSLPRKDDLKCDTCGKTFDNVSNVKRHKYAVHVKGDSSAKSSKKDAKKQSQSEETAKKKLFTENETENENDEEEETFSGEPPENDGPHNCHICKKNFSCLGYLMQHLAKHAGDKPFQCDVCGKGFAMSTYLRKHRASHTSSKGTQATPPSSPVKSEITDTEKDPKVSTLSTMQTRKRKLAVTPDNKNNDVTGKNKSKEQKTQNLEKNDDIATPNKKAKTQEKDDDIATPNTRSKNLEKDDNIATPNKKSKSQEKKDDDMAATNTRSKDQEKEDDDMATTNTRSKTQEKKDDDMATTNTRSKTQEKKDDDIARSKIQEKGKDIVTPKTRSKNQKLVKKEDTESVKQDDDIKSPKVDDIKSPKERSTRSRTVKIEGESKGVVCRSSGDDPLKCDVCGKQFHLPYNYMIHQKMHQVEEEKEFKCDECGSRFKRASGLKKHQETHKKPKTPKTETHNKVKADSKKVKITPQKPVSDSPQTDVSGSPQTDVSGSPQKTVTGRPQRAAASRSQRVVTSSPTKGTPIQSIKIETISLNEKLQLDQICKCNTCGKQFADSASLSYHETQHVTNMLKCAYCPKSFFTKYNLDRHESHHNKGPKVDIRSVSVIAVQTNTSEIRKNRKLHESGNSEKKFPVAYHSKRRLGTNIKDKVSVKKQAINKKLKDKLNTSKAKGKVRVQGRTCSVCGVKIYGTFSYRRHLLIHSKYKKMLTDGNINNSSVQSYRPKPSNESVKNRITTSKTKKKPEISSPKNKQVFQSPKSELKSYECHICKKQLSRQYNLKRHLEQHHKLTIIPENTSSKSDEVSKVNAEITDVSKSDVQVDSNETVDDAENTIMVVKHGDDDKDKAVTFFGDFTSQGVNIPEGSIITVMEEETGEELFKVEVNELCSETSESKNVAITKTTNSAEKSQTSLLCTEVLEVDEKSPQNSKLKLNDESKGNQSNPETSSVATNSKENLAGDIAKSAAPQNEEATKLINTEVTDTDK